jgi:hypothetical protein
MKGMTPPQLWKAMQQNGQWPRGNCFVCGKRGHFAKQCAQRQRQQQQPQRSLPQTTANSVPPPPAFCPRCTSDLDPLSFGLYQVPVRTVPWNQRLWIINRAYWIQQIGQKRPELELKISGKKFKGLIDIRADVSVISLNHWPATWPMQPAVTQLWYWTKSISLSKLFTAPVGGL